MSAHTEVLEREVAPSLPAQAGGTVDTQVATARRYPRSITAFMQRAQELATLNGEIAASCVYAVPREGKMIEGPSARLAEIVAHAWGNLRIQAGTTEIDDRFITARGEAWDVESNVAIAFEVRRRITGRAGKTYSDDMVTVTGNAAASIALRNAVFKTVPSSFWKPIYAKCRQVIAGDAKTFHARRDEMLKQFGVMGVTPQQLSDLVGVKGPLDITLEHMVTLTGVFTAIKDGDTTIEEAFAKDAPIQQPQRKAEGDTTKPAAGVVDVALTPKPAAAPDVPGVTVALERRQPASGGPAFWIVRTSDQRIFLRPEDGDGWSEIVQALQRAQSEQRAVFLTLAAVDGQKYPNVVEVAFSAEATS